MLPARLLYPLPNVKVTHYQRYQRPLRGKCEWRRADDPEIRYEIAELLLEAGADPNTRQQDEFTPLMEADQNGDERLARLLEEHGARRD